MKFRLFPTALRMAILIVVTVVLPCGRVVSQIKAEPGIEASRSIDSEFDVLEAPDTARPDLFDPVEAYVPAPTSINLLDNVRARNSLGRDLTSPQSIVRKIHDLKQKLSSPDADRSSIEADLKKALDEYFMNDMHRRVRELDELKQKLIETDAKLQKRLSEREQAVSLQLRLILPQSSDSGFFQPEDAQTLSALGGSMSGPGMAAGMGFDDGGYGGGAYAGMGPGLSGGGDYGGGHFGGMGPGLGGGLSAPKREPEPIAPNQDELAKVLAKTLMLSLRTNNSGILIQDPESSRYDSTARTKLAQAILRALGADADPNSIQFDDSNGQLQITFTLTRWEELGQYLPAVIQTLKKEAEQRKEQRAEEAKRELLNLPTPPMDSPPSPMPRINR